MKYYSYVILTRILNRIEGFAKRGPATKKVRSKKNLN